MLKAMYRENKNIMRTNNEESKEFTTGTGVKKGCMLNLLEKQRVWQSLLEIKTQFRITWKKNRTGR